MCWGVGKSGSPAPKPDDRLAGRLERLGLGVDGQGGGLGDGRDATGDTGITGHGPIVARAGRSPRTDCTAPPGRVPPGAGVFVPPPAERRVGGTPIWAIRPTSLDGHMTRIRRAGPRRSPLLRIGVGARRALLAATVLTTVAPRRSPPARSGRRRPRRPGHPAAGVLPGRRRRHRGDRRREQRARPPPHRLDHQDPDGAGGARAPARRPARSTSAVSPPASPR